MSSRADWLEAVADLFGSRTAELASLADVLDDASCWFDAEDIRGRTIIPVPQATTAKVVCYLARADAGGGLPMHRHAGRETVLVLRGGLSDSLGRRVRAGGLLISEPGTEHSVDADPELGVICAVRIDFIGEEKTNPRDRGVRPPHGPNVSAAEPGTDGGAGFSAVPPRGATPETG